MIPPPLPVSLFAGAGFAALEMSALTDGFAAGVDMKDGFVAVPIGFTLVIGWLAYVGVLPTGATVGLQQKLAGFCITAVLPHCPQYLLR